MAKRPTKKPARKAASPKKTDHMLSLSAKSMAGQLKLSKSLETAVLKHPEGTEFAQLLAKKPQLGKLPLDKLLDINAWVEARATQPETTKFNKAEVFRVARDVYVGRGMEGDTGAKRVAIMLGEDEFISAQVRDGSLIEASIRIFGISPFRFDQLSKSEIRSMRTRLHSTHAERAALLWQHKRLPFKDKELVLGARYLSQILTQLRDATNPHVLWHHAHPEDVDCETNGCSVVPDFDFTDCCDEHDRCYCRGCTETDRLQCDRELYECIKARGHPVLAAIYYAGVVALGGPHFNYCPEDETDLTGQSSGSPAAPQSCMVTVKLIHVRHASGDVGNDWSYDVAVDGSTRSYAEHTLNPGTTKSWGDVLFSGIKGQCGDTVSLVLSANATEHDFGPDDISGSTSTVSISCPGTYYHTVSVSVPELWETTSKLDFKFEITAICTA